MRQAVKLRKIFQARIPLILDPGKKIPKKIAKNSKNFKKFKKISFRHYFQPNWDEIGRERDKTNLGPNSVHIGLRQGNSERNSKKIKEPLFGIIPKQKWMRRAEKGRKKFQSRIPFILDPGKKIPKKIAKNFKKLKNLFLAIFQAKTG